MRKSRQIQQKSRAGYLVRRIKKKKAIWLPADPNLLQEIGVAAPRRRRGHPPRSETFKTLAKEYRDRLYPWVRYIVKEYNDLQRRRQAHSLGAILNSIRARAVKRTPTIAASRGKRGAESVEKPKVSTNPFNPKAAELWNALEGSGVILVGPDPRARSEYVPVRELPWEVQNVCKLIDERHATGSRSRPSVKAVRPFAWIVFHVFDYFNKLPARVRDRLHTDSGIPVRHVERLPEKITDAIVRRELSEARNPLAAQSPDGTWGLGEQGSDPLRSLLRPRRDPRRRRTE